jgi:hypothetical protein
MRFGQPMEIGFGDQVNVPVAVVVAMNEESPAGHGPNHRDGQHRQQRQDSPTPMGQST